MFVEVTGKENGREGQLFGPPILNKVNRGEQLQYFLSVTTLMRPSLVFAIIQNCLPTPLFAQTLPNIQ